MIIKKYMPLIFYYFLLLQLSLTVVNAFFTTGVLSETEILKLDSKTSLHVSDYGEGILRLTLKPNTESFYEVENVVIRKPENAKIDSKCSTSTCAIKSGNCVITTNVLEEIFYASYKCNDLELSSLKLPLNTIENPSLDFTFPYAKRLYGIPEHATNLSLIENLTYSMYNTDAFQYKIDNPQALYGSIPFILAHSTKFSTGILFLNSAGMTLQVTSGNVIGCQWNAEVGLVDLFFFPGSTPAKVQAQHASITGSTLIPPYFSLGYHQSRWNYRSTSDCLSVDQGFDRYNLPYDVLWLDIEHTDGKKYFTWDKHNFPEPKVLIEAIAAKGRKLVTVKDPHVKREEGYYVHKEAEKGNHYVKASDGEKDYEGKCWPGQSSWVDFYNKRTRDWYGSLFHHDRYEGATHDVFTWVDMNEPSVFDGPDNTIHRDAIHISDTGKKVENKYLHNMYSLYSVMAIYQGHLETSKGLPHIKRPFILTRSFFAGSQRFAAMWTGDNMAQWNHLQNSFPELLSLSVSNFPFCGADIGGFFFEPDEELFVRWVQAGVFYPFMRAHAHLETKRREPWTFGETATDRIRIALALRYSLLPYLYTQFYLSHKTGSIILRPLFYEFPHDESLYDEQYTFMFGPSLLAAPVLKQGITEMTITIPSNNLWYSYATGELIPSGQLQMTVDMNTIPLFIRGGHIIPTKLRLRRNTLATKNDPYTLYVALNEQGNSNGELYIDDGESFDYELGAYIHRRFSFTSNQLKCSVFPGTSSSDIFTVNNSIERVLIFGYQEKPKRVIVESSSQSILIGREIEFELQGGALVLRKPDLPVSDTWTITIEN